MKNKLLIIGASGHGKVVADIALEMNKWSSIEFLDDNKTIKNVMGLDVIGSSKDMLNYIDEYEIFVGIGDNAIRKRIYEKLKSAGATIPILIHPNAVIGSEVSIESGTVVMAGVVINCCTQIGQACIINTGSTVDHDNSIGDYVHMSPGARLAGTVKVGQESWLGIGSVVSNNINISSRSIVGAGSVVIKNINEPGRYVGTPVRRL
ncbi:acetyltransferase [Sporosarcina sp. P13]|uniref:acetyltransferase n=1 Tax=Sporosarcina sp. P13 TaxID=2048263 RepID=UPI000C164C60|nr:acetyltransferase [Sporosarcina sp. P13]PIC63996.1 acetyltransferase [Sporosarcina sp. P13]